MKYINLIEEKVFPALIRFTLPVLLAMLLQTLYGTVDLLIVGQFSSVADLSAVTVSTQVMQTVTAFCTGIAMGTTILIGKYMGRQEQEKTSQVVGTSILLFSALSIFTTTALLLFHPLIAQLMQTPEESLSQTKTYLAICGAGSVFIVFYNLLSSVFRGMGDSKTPLLTVAIAFVINIVLDIFLVAILQLGAMGAALATVTAQGASVALSLLFLKKRPLPFTLSKNLLQYHPETGKNIVKLGFPVALQSVLVNISFLTITSIVNGFGVNASAGVGIVEKISGIILVVPLSFMQALSAFVAQNIGANEEKRAKQALFYSITISLVFGTVIAFLCMFHGTLFTSAFVSDEPETTLAAISYLKSYAFDCIFTAFLFPFCGYFNGKGKTTFVMAQGIFGACCMRIPLAFYFSTLPDTSLFLIGMATPCSTFFQIILFMIYYLHDSKKKD